VATEPGRALDGAAVVAWMSEIAKTMRAERDHLVQLDAAIGDGDHGVNMNRGFDAVVQALDATDETMPGKLLILAGKTLVSTVGGASGPLWGSALRRAGRALGDRLAIDDIDLVDALDAAAAAIAELGGAVPGDKTMLDAFMPAVGALRDSLDSGGSLTAALEAAAEAAEEGMRATVPMQAHKGRASYLGERSIGHQDPGATSTALIFRALQRTISGDG
jgi:dihydroxyacetone kinase-like protein